MEILAIIPARGGSKGIPRKNIKMLAGKPLIGHTISASLNSKYITRTVVSTEDAEIAEVAKKCGAEVVERPMELAQDTTMTAPVMTHVVDYLKKTENYYPDLVILLQCTCPLRTAEDIDKAFEFYFKQEDCDSVFAAIQSGPTHGAWRKEKDGSFKSLYDYRTRPRRQDTDRHYPLFWETGSIYIIQTDVMMKVVDFVGDKPQIFEVKPIVDIDELSDFETCEKILKERELVVH